jgi:hypothetical protein
MQTVQKLRKHRVQMSPDEISFAESFVRSLQPVVNPRNAHFVEEMQNDGLQLDDILLTLKMGDIIEVNDLGRCLVRMMSGPKSGTCAVINIYNGHIVTAWKNNPNDHHKTLRLSEYRWNVNVTEFLRGRN